MLTRIGIVTHPKRATQAENLADAINAEMIARDDGTYGCTRNHIRAWFMHQHLNMFEAEFGAPSPDWFVVLEDDAVPVLWIDFRVHLANMLNSAPTPLVSLYLGRQRPPQYQHQVAAAVCDAIDADAHYLVADRLLHGVGIAVHSSILPKMINHLGAQGESTPIDEMISDWARLNGIQTTYCWPSLVDHADTESVAAHPDCEPRKSGRVAYKIGSHPVWQKHRTVSAQWR